MTYQPGEILLDKYRIEAQVGQGAFAEVYRAFHFNLNVVRALKVLRKNAPGLGSTEFNEYQGRFRLEAQLGARLSHPNIIQLHDVETYGDDLILVMDYAAGGSLGQAIDSVRESGKSFPLKKGLILIQEAADGLSALHALDVVHRDLKPSNILIDEKGHARVADLGLAQVPGGPSMRSQLSNPMPHPGTPAYMSPEQKIASNYLTSASDVFSLGLVLFEILTGRVYRSQRVGVLASSLRDDIPAWLNDLLALMLAENPQDRPWDGHAVAELLRSGLSREPSGRPPFEDPEKQRREKQIADLKSTALSALAQKNWSAAQNAIAALDGCGEQGRAQAVSLRKRLAEARLAQEAADRARKRLLWIGILAALVFCSVSGVLMFSNPDFRSWFLGGTGQTAVAVDGSQPQPQIEPFQVTEPAILIPATQHLTIQPTRVKTAIPPAQAPASSNSCDLGSCQVSAGSVCVYSFGPEQNKLMIALKFSEPVNPLDVPDLMVGNIAFDCEPITSYPDRLYCFGASVSGNAMLELVSDRGDLICSGSVSIPKYVTPVPTPKKAKNSGSGGTYP